MCIDWVRSGQSCLTDQVYQVRYLPVQPSYSVNKAIVPYSLTLLRSGLLASLHTIHVSHPPTTYGFLSGCAACLLLLLRFIRHGSGSKLSFPFFPLDPHFIRQKNDLLAPEHSRVGVGWFSVLSGRPVFASISLSRGVVSEDDSCSLTLLTSFWCTRSRKLCPTRSDCSGRKKNQTATIILTLQLPLLYWLYG